MNARQSQKKPLEVNLLINLASRAARKQYHAILQSCADNNIHVAEIFELRRGGDLTAIIDSIRNTGCSVLIVAGGDGTVSDVTHLLVGSDIHLGIIPLGTTNNFAKSLGMPLTVAESVERIRNSQAKYINIGKADDKYFANVASIGISGVIASKVKDKHKKVFGRAAYGITGFRELFVHRPFTVTISDIDGEMEVIIETHQLVIASGRFHAGKEIADEASLKTDEVIIFAIGGRSRFSFFVHMFDFYVGKRRSVRHLSYFLGRHVRVGTDVPQKVEIDGELKTSTPIEISVAKNAIKVRY